MPNYGLREGADSYISEVKGDKEQFVLAIEYCSALPAGNNAWQRNGRALSSVLAGIPYLFISELGGVELNENREAVAARTPNPLVPFSYLCLSKDYNQLCIPVYRPHPSITDELNQKYDQVFGYKDSLNIINGILSGTEIEDYISILFKKSLKLIELLSKDSRGNKTLKGKEWSYYLKSKNRSKWILKNSDLIWNKKNSSKVNAPSRIKELIPKAVSLSLSTIGAANIPICLIARNRIVEFERLLKHYYPLIHFNIPKNKPLAVVWITGYKPTGDDSRPDRGLCPLAKMILGDSCKIISIVYGPAKSQTWEMLKKGLNVLASSNGLWQSIYKICDGVFIDSVTKPAPEYIKIKQSTLYSHSELVIPFISNYHIEHTEHDIDTAIHQILTRSDLEECLCNPPGGDWSGINFYKQGDIYRWISLPRVSEVGGKRPDHVFQQESENGSLFITIESKGNATNLEYKIGDNLVSYLQNLFSLAPTSVKKINTEWRLNNDKIDLGNFSVISVGAFIYKSDEELKHYKDRGNLDCIMAFELNKISVLHLLTNNKGRILKDLVKEAAKRISGFEIKIH